MADLLDHPLFGQLRWEPKRTSWFGQVQLTPQKRLDVILDPGDGDRLAFIEPAAQLYRRVLEAERRILRDVVERQLLELFNDNWRQEEEAELTADELIGKLELELIDIGTVVPVELWYSDGPEELFGGHSVVLMLDGDLRFKRIDLRG